MTTVFGWAYLLVAMILVAASAWINRRIRAHIRRNHPLHLARISVPPAPLGPTDNEVRRTDEYWRLQEFIASGHAARLQDPALDRLVRWRRRLFWILILALAAFTASLLILEIA